MSIPFILLTAHILFNNLFVFRSNEIFKLGIYYLFTRFNKNYKLLTYFYCTICLILHNNLMLNSSYNSNKEKNLLKLILKF